MVRTWQAKMLFVLYLSMVLVCCSCEDEGTAGPSTSAGSSRPTDVVYNRYNLHYVTQRGGTTASYANYTDCPGHAFLPYNTQCRIGYYSKGFRVVAVDSGLEIGFEYKSSNMDGMSVSAYKDLIFSVAPVSYEGLSAKDQEGIKAGRAMPGMTKQGVMIALGYPAKHETPSTDSNTWTYWKNRFSRRAVQFDANGLVKAVSQ